MATTLRLKVHKHIQTHMHTQTEKISHLHFIAKAKRLQFKTASYSVLFTVTWKPDCRQLRCFLYLKCNSKVTRFKHFIAASKLIFTMKHIFCLEIKNYKSILSVKECQDKLWKERIGNIMFYYLLLSFVPPLNVEFCTFRLRFMSWISIFLRVVIFPTGSFYIFHFYLRINIIYIILIENKLLN